MNKIKIMLVIILATILTIISLVTIVTQPQPRESKHWSDYHYENGVEPCYEGGPSKCIDVPNYFD